MEMGGRTTRLRQTLTDQDPRFAMHLFMTRLMPFKHAVYAPR